MRKGVNHQQNEKAKKMKRKRKKETMKSPNEVSRTCLFESDARVYAKMDPALNTNYGRWKRELPSLPRSISKKVLNKKSPTGASKANLNKSIR